MRSVVRWTCVCTVVASSAAAQQKPAPVTDTTKKVQLSQGPHTAKPRAMPKYTMPALTQEQQTAYDLLGPQFASEIPQVPGWYRDTPVQYYVFDNVAQPVIPVPVYWPVYGFDAASNPVAIRGQRPIFSALPSLSGYTGLWKLVYVVTADNVLPNELRDVQAIEKLVKRKKALLRETNFILNLPITPRGALLANDTASGSLGWYQGRDVQYYDFGTSAPAASLMWRFTSGNDANGAPIIVAGQNSIVDTIPVAATAPDLWEIHFVRTDTTFVPGSLKSAKALQASSLVVDPASTIRNLPITTVDGKPVNRPKSPLRVFADTRSPFPPAPTRPQ